MSHRVVAGFLAGSSAGLIKKSGMWGFNVGLLFGIAAVIRKEMGFKGYELIPTTVRVSWSSVLLSVVVTEDGFLAPDWKCVRLLGQLLFI